ncbi:MAG: MFS transporter [Asgard group archaeon]|nr:MFS transporter [Asgard group archaeon]
MTNLNEPDNVYATESRKNLPIIIIGILGLFTIASVGMLHTNEKEFIEVFLPLASNFQISLYDTVLYISYLIFGIITGVISDRLGKRKVFILVGSAGSALFSWLLTISPSFASLLVFRFLQGTFTVLVWQIFMTLVLDVSSPTTRGKNMGIFGTFLAISMGLSPLVGGFLADVGVFMPYYVAVGFSGAVLILSIFLIKEPENISKRPSLKQNFSAAVNNSKLIIPASYNFIDRFHMGFILFALPLLILDVLDLGPSMRGIALAIFGLPFILLQYPFGKLSDKYGRYIFLITGSIGYGIVLSLVGFLGSISFAYLVSALVFLGILSGITNPANMALVADYVKKEDRAMGMGFYNFAGNLGIVLGPVIGGILLINSSYVVAFIWMGVIEFLGVLINTLLLRFMFKQKKVFSRTEYVTFIGSDE